MQISEANKHLPSHSFPKTEVIRWKNDNFDVEGLLTYPTDYSPLADTKPAYIGGGQTVGTIDEQGGDATVMQPPPAGVTNGPCMFFNNGNTLGDGTDASDIPPQDQFPFFALPQQPRAPGVTDDNTRN